VPRTGTAGHSNGSNANIGPWRSLTAVNQRIRSDCPCWVPTRYPRAPVAAIPTRASWIAISSRSGAPSGKLSCASTDREASGSAWVGTDAAAARCHHARQRCLSQPYLARESLFRGFLQIKQNGLSMFEE